MEPIHSISHLTRSLSFFRLMSFCLVKFRSAFCKVALFSFRMALNVLESEISIVGIQNDDSDTNTTSPTSTMESLLPPPNKKKED